MARLEKTIRWRDVSGGVVQKVSPDITIPNAVPFSMNLEYDKVLGEAVSRRGTAIVGAQEDGGGDSCLGIFQHIDTTFANSVLFAGFNQTLYDIIDSAVDLGSLTAGAKQRFCTFQNATLMLNGNEARSYTNAGGWISTAGAFDLANIPGSASLPIEFKDRVYCVTSGDTLNYTALPAAGVVAWTATGSGSLLVEREDGGGSISGLNKVPGYLMIYKQRSLKRWNFDTSFPEDLVNIGTQSNESIVRARGKNFFFYGPNGFYETDGRFPKLISRPIQRVIDGMATSFYDDVNGWSDGYDVYWSLGSVTFDFDRGYTETYTNVVVKYTLDTQQWAILRYNHLFSFLNQYLTDENTNLIVGGDADGHVIQLNTGTTDYATTPVPITFILESPEFDFGFREYRKTLTDRLYVHSDLTKGAQLQVRLDYGEWTEMGSLDDIVSEIKIAKPLIARVFQFRMVDSLTGHIIKLRGMDFPNVDVHSTG